MKPRCFGKLTTAAFVLAAGFGTAQAEDIPVGHLATTSGETSRVAEIYGQGPAPFVGRGKIETGFGCEQIGAGMVPGSPFHEILYRLQV